MTDVRTMSLRLPTALHARLADMAKTDRRSLNAEIVRLLELAVVSRGGSGRYMDAIPPRPQAPGAQDTE